MKYYHASRRAFGLKPGDFINPQPCDWVGLAVFLTNDPRPHWTLWHMTDEEDDINLNINVVRYVIYQVHPQGKVKRGRWADLYTDKPVEVIRSLGQATTNPKAVSSVKPPLRCWFPTGRVYPDLDPPKERKSRTKPISNRKRKRLEKRRKW